MSELHENPAPTVPLIFAASLVVLSLLGVIWQKLVVTPNAEVQVRDAQVVQSRTLQFRDAGDGSVIVFDMESGEALNTLAPGEGGFLRGTLRGLVRERKTAGADMAPGFELTQYSDGTVVLKDQATGREIDLRAFGAMNADNFLRYLRRDVVARSEGEG
ncbi:MAG: photosynthetic complex assembly protein PuhC [Woeseiaceae bacterium]